MLLKFAQITIELQIILNFLLQSLNVTIFTYKLIFYGTVLKILACVALLSKAGDEVIENISDPLLQRKQMR
jgi:hypothetical protein